MAKPTVVKSSVPSAERQVKLPIIDNPSAPDLYADEVLGFLLTNNTLRVTLASIKVDHAKSPGVNNCVVSGRLVLPLAAAQKLHNMLGSVLEKVKSQQAGGNSTTIKTLQ